MPALAARVEAPLTRLARFGPRGRGEGFWSGLLVGGGLGFVYAPCAGPILAAVVSVSATQGASGELVAVALGYAAGSALVLLLLAYGGRRVLDRLRAAGRGPAVQRALGVVMVATAVAVATDLDVRFQTALANDFPAFLTNPTRALERSGAVEDRLADLRGRARFAESRRTAPIAGPGFRCWAAHPTSPATSAGSTRRAGAPLDLRELRGQVVLVDFWTYTCINCIRTLPYLRAWDGRYRRRGLTIVGVHTPEFAFERDADNVERAIAQNQLRYPVAQDNEFATWNAWGNQYWPAKYLIDARGRVRYAHFGEGAYDETESAIRALLAEAGAARLGAPARALGGDAVARAGHAGDLSRATSARRASTRRCGPASALPGRRRAAAGALRARRDLERSEQSATAVRDAAHRRARDGAQGVPRAGHERRPPARAAGAARRPADAGREAGET